MEGDSGGKNRGITSSRRRAPYDWFAMGKQYVLHGFIDDTTGNITARYLA
jgi:hypothetical protein